ncbi:MAG: hypothetical protein DRN18_00555 [Thermoplasmata archaeon]|nr:MAG: hypothetical protein DRN18_00555 [Thermoplasmata archaeon]
MEQIIYRFKRGDPEKILLYTFNIFLPILIAFIISFALSSLLMPYVSSVEKFLSIPSAINLLILFLMIVVYLLLYEKEKESLDDLLSWAYAISGRRLLLFNYVRGDKKTIEYLQKSVGSKDPDQIKEFVISIFKKVENEWRNPPRNSFELYSFPSYLTIFLIVGTVYNLLIVLPLPWPYIPHIAAILLAITFPTDCLRDSIEKFSIDIYPPTFVSEVEVNGGKIFTGWLRKITGDSIVVETLNDADKTFDRMIIPKSEVRVIHNYLVKVDEKIA